jgi:hypothetical protein
VTLGGQDVRQEARKTQGHAGQRRPFAHFQPHELDPVKIPLLRHNLRVSLNCPFRREEAVGAPSDMLSLPANLQIHMGDCRVLIPTLRLVGIAC